MRADSGAERLGYKMIYKSRSRYKYIKTFPIYFDAGLHNRMYVIHDVRNIQRHGKGAETRGLPPFPGTPQQESK